MDQPGSNPTLMVSRAGKMSIPLSPFAPEILFSRDGFGGPVPRQPSHLHTQVEALHNERKAYSYIWIFKI